MPGNSPREAFDNFVAPLKRAVSCLGAAKIVASPGGRDQPGIVHSWSLNGQTGLACKGGFHLEAQMHYKIVRDEAPGRGPWRISTRAYRYRVARIGTDVFRIHWHPWGQSPYRDPHIHLNFAVPGRAPTTLDEHFPTGRLTFEDAIEWAVGIGVPVARDDWQDVLADARAVHLAHRSWGTTPPTFPEP
jgi:hypothetical protein